MTRYIRCPGCNGRLADVLSTRHHVVKFWGREVTRIRRRRKCVHCGSVWTTVETLEDPDVPGQPAPPPAPPQLPPADPGDSPPNPYL